MRHQVHVLRLDFVLDLRGRASWEVRSLLKIDVLITSLAAGLALCIVSGAGASESQRLAPAVTVCPGFNGPAWVFSTTKGTKYSLETSGGYKCSLATTWV